MTPACSSTAAEERTFTSQCAKLSQHQLSSMTSFNETIVAPAKGERTTYQAMRDALPAYHPCSRASIGECYRSFVAGMRA